MSKRQFPPGLLPFPGDDWPKIEDDEPPAWVRWVIFLVLVGGLLVLLTQCPGMSGGYDYYLDSDGYEEHEAEYPRVLYEGEYKVLRDEGETEIWRVKKP